MSKQENKNNEVEEMYSDVEEDIANSNDEYWLLNVEEEKSRSEQAMDLYDAYFTLYNSTDDYEDPDDFEPEEEFFDEEEDEDDLPSEPEPLDLGDEELPLDGNVNGNNKGGSSEITLSDDDLPY